MTKTEARALKRAFADYVPRGGKPLTQDQIGKLVFRATLEHEIYHCGTQTGDDIQSGPYYCGDIADFVAPAPVPGGGVVALCGKHKRKICP